MAFSRCFTGTRWEKAVGYCRAIRADNLVFVTGTAPVADDGSVYAPGDAYAQARRCLEIIEGALEKMGVSRGQVVRTRMFVTDISLWERFGKAHAEFFAEHPPATSMVEVRRLIEPQMLIEIEADAVCCQA